LTLMGGQRRPHPIGVVLPPTGRTLDIGEQKRHHPRRRHRRISGHPRRMPHRTRSHLEDHQNAGARHSCPTGPGWCRGQRHLLRAGRWGISFVLQRKNEVVHYACAPAVSTK
jgi:hypothetical protein